MVNFNENDRRIGSDWINRLLSVFAVLAWLSFILALIWFHYARPDIIPGFAVYKGIEDQFRDEWLKRWTDRLSIQLVLCCLLSLAAMGLNLLHLRRKSDHFHTSLLMLFLICFAFVLYLYVIIYPQF